MKKKLCLLTLSVCMLFSQSAWAANGAQSGQVDVITSQEQIAVQSTSYPVGEDSGITIQKKNYDNIVLSDANYQDRYNQSIIVDSNNRMWTVYPTVKKLAENVQYCVEYDAENGNDSFSYVDMEDNLWINNKKSISNVAEANEDCLLDTKGALYSSHTGEKLLDDVAEWNTVYETTSDDGYEKSVYALKEDHTLWKKGENTPFQKAESNVKQLVSWGYLREDGTVVQFNKWDTGIEEKASLLVEGNGDAYYDENGTFKYLLWENCYDDLGSIQQIEKEIRGLGQAPYERYFLTATGEVYVPHYKTPLLTEIADTYEDLTWGTEGICFIGTDDSYYDCYGKKLGASSVLKDVMPLQMKGNSDGTNSVISEDGTEVLDHVVDLWRGGLTGSTAIIYALRTDGTVWSVGTYGGQGAADTPRKVLDLTKNEMKADQWIHDNKGWWYSYANGGYPANKWEFINGNWYWFNSEGYMVTGWNSIGGNWYYMNNSGAMQTGWNLTGEKWYYMNSSGAMATGWLLFGEDWYYMNNSGAMVTGWNSIGGNWYYMNSSGEMVTGWNFIGGNWYYMNSSGAMQSNQWISGVYYVKSDGRMATSEWVNGYYVGADGVWRG